MTDMQKAYTSSVIKALRDGIKCSTHKTPLWIRVLLDRLYGAIPARMPSSVLAVRGVTWTHDMDSFADRVCIGLLLEKGWGVDQSIMVYKNFRLAHPLYRFDPQMWRTFSRKQLRDELGYAYGDIVADLCSDPSAQPVFHALMFGEISEPIPRAFGSVTLNMVVLASAVEELTQRGELHKIAETALNGLTDLSETISPLTGLDAAYQFFHRTGEKLTTTTDINPKAFNHDLAAIRAAFWETQRGIDLHLTPQK